MGAPHLNDRRRRKTDASSFVVIVIAIVGEGQGRGGAPYPEKTEEREGKNNDLVADKQRRRCPSSPTTATMDSPSDVRVDLHRSVCAVCATRLRHLGGAVAGHRLPWRLRCRASSVVVGGGKALGLSAGIAIVVLDWACILLDERFGVCADPWRGDNDDGNEDD